MNISPIAIYDRPRPHKVSCYTPDLLPDTISVAYESSVINFTTPSDFPQLLILISDNPNLPHAMNKDWPYSGRLKHDEKYATKRRGSVAWCALINTRNFISVMGFSVLIQRQGLAS